ncbi:hypothetical protein [Vandammella animalimorsus]|uniref:hypothetical protein n=1 Tax=Vandammella animalimorsus TaxID=2029117 RepID=UPI0011C3E19A|nr:hypothetical protein [Vandammella animalimorsus]
MSEDKSYIKNLNLSKILGALIASGSLFIVAGSGITLLYFWSIGGVPVGQAGSAISMAKVVISSAFFVFILVTTIWLIPIATSQLLLNEEFSTKITEKYFQKKNEDTKASGINFSEILKFYFFTIGVSYIFLFFIFPLFISAKLCEHEKSAICEFRWLICLIGIGAWNATYLYFKFKKCKYAEESSDSQQLWQWLGWGILTSSLAIFPFILLLQLFLTTDLILSTQSPLVLFLGSLGICAAIVLAHAFSLWFFLQRNQGKSIRWLSFIAVNLAILLFLFLSLGIFPRLLEAIMRISSVRVENAVLVLNSDGCEILTSISAAGYKRKNEKTCILCNATIQSTLEPAMQVAGFQKAGQKMYPVVFTIPTSYVKSIYKIKYPEQTESKKPTLGQDSAICSDLSLSNESRITTSSLVNDN